jgi:hypothetical protein
MASGAEKSLGRFVLEVRQYLRDFPELNRLIDGEETSDRMIAWAVLDALDDINATPPLTGAYTIDTFPRSILLRGTVIAVLESVGLLQTRNQINYSDGGIQVSASDKAPMLMQWINMLRGSYEQKKQQYKIAVNISSAFEGSAILSDYYFLGGYYDVFDRIYR